MRRLRFAFAPILMMTSWLFLTACGYAKINLSGTESSSTAVTSQTWTFSSPADYDFNPSYIQISQGSASLLPVATSFSGTTGFSAGAFDGSFVTASGFLTMQQKNDFALELTSILPSRTSALVGYWKMNGDFSDSSGQGNTAATYAGSPGFSGDSIVGTNSGKFDGSSSLVVSNSGSIQAIANISFSAWIKVSRIQSPNSNSGITVWKMNQGAGLYNEVACFKIFADGSVGFTVTGVNASGAAVYTNTNPILPSTWTHVAGTYDGNTIKVFINGALVGTTAYAGGAIAQQPGTTLFIGKYWPDGAPLYNPMYFQGTMDDLGIWNTGLADADIKAIYNAQNPVHQDEYPSWQTNWSNLAAYYKGDGYLTDSTGLAGAATAATGSSLTTTAVKVGSGAMTFDGSANGYATLPTTTALNALQASNFSLSSWVQFSALPTAGQENYLIGKPGSPVGISVTGTDRHLRFHHTLADGTALVAVGTTALQNGVFYFAAGVFDDANGKLGIYLNGKLEQQISFTPGATPFGYGSTAWTIGSLSAGTSAMTGVLDDVALWSTALSAGDVSTIFEHQKQNSAGSYTSPVIDIGTAGVWTGLSISSMVPYGKELTGDTDGDGLPNSENIMSYPSVYPNLQSGLTALWHLNETSAGTATGASDFADSSGLGFHATHSGAVSFGARGQLANAAGFDGSTSAVSAGTGPALAGVTLSAWVQFAAAPSAASIYGIVGRFQNATGKHNYYLEIKNNLLVMGFHDGTSLHEIAGSQSTWIPGNWYYVVGTYDGTAGALYINGASEVVSSGTLSGIPNVAGGGFTTLLGVQSSTPTNVFFGALDEIAIWTRAIAAAEQFQIYLQQANRLKYQIRSCPDSACASAPWIGPDGTGTSSFSELQNYSALTSLGGGTGSSLLSPLSLSFSSFAPAGLNVSSNRYFQYRALLESDLNATVCSGISCGPTLTSLTVTPTNRYYGGSPTISNHIPISYKNLDDFLMTSTSSCAPTVQISNNGTSYYYWNGTVWATATTSVQQSNNLSDLRSHLKSFTSSVGAGGFYFKAFLPSNLTQNCQLSSVEVDLEN